MKNVLKVSALAFVFAAALTSCEQKPAETSTTTETNSAETTVPAEGTMTDSTATMSTDATTTTPADGTMAPAEGTTTTSTTTTTTEEQK